jgi:hypothetical protein
VLREITLQIEKRDLLLTWDREPLLGRERELLLRKRQRAPPQEGAGSSSLGGVNELFCRSLQELLLK